uniref:Uncharacterized protein n=1 Tax=viral metagenome TaxID=1070528 RepID=A0A6M3IT72_9ZZZZ
MKKFDLEDNFRWCVEQMDEYALDLLQETIDREREKRNEEQGQSEFHKIFPRPEDVFKML